ncbi:conserved exported hypothetical protein [Magnetospirillum sp. LM-5]|uniref:hypothetical protein n=1 Tax=Magnetospirillum sp. LM-5 TaxID=2681466 RepID=UPI001382A79A|nr:hypothetical protein [Magnetospirillum sp. LM-5]CAA7625865.1 conserved exported hypothetical protein [Magnetospirillum sp. LM-5]
MRRTAGTLIVLAAVLLSGCGAQSYRTTERLVRTDAHPRIMLMPPDIELSERTAGGSNELNAAWTKAAEAHFATALREHLTSIGADFVEYLPPDDASENAPLLDELQSLHATVGQTILDYHFVPALRLPAKKGQFDWSLGPEVTKLAEHGKADYALFVWLRDSYSSPGRMALKVVAALVVGVPVSGGEQRGLCSLVDLKTGQVVWFNALLPRESGDMRTLEESRATTRLLLDRMPK